jgi:hypothetical protein
VACCALLLVLASGCGPDYKSRGVVKGRVTAGRKLLTAGTVMFYGPGGITASAGIDPDGNYEMPDAPVGECQVTVTVPPVPMDPTIKALMTGKGKIKVPKMQAGPTPPEGFKADMGDAPTDLPNPSAARIPTEIVPIDPKYSKPETSGLKFEVKKGEQHTYNIDL